MDISTLLQHSLAPSRQAGEPAVGFTVAYEDSVSPTGWDLGVVKMIDGSVERMSFVVASTSGWLVLNRGRILRWWPAA